jgi:hypothetical protein
MVYITLPIIVVVTVQITFHLEIHQNNFLFLQAIFDISISKRF